MKDSHIGVEHIALALTRIASGLVPPIVSSGGRDGTGAARRHPRPVPAGGLTREPLTGRDTGW